MTSNLSFGKWAKRYDGNPLSTGVLDRLSHKALADLPAPQSGRHISMVDDDELFTGSTVRHLRFNAIDDYSVAPLRRAIFPFDLLASRRSISVRAFAVVRPHFAAPTMRAVEQISIPATQIGGSFVGGDEKRHERLIRIGRRLNRFVRQDKL
jgi:hypothetical protein